MITSWSSASDSQCLNIVGFVVFTLPRCVAATVLTLAVRTDFKCDSVYIVLGSDICVTAERRKDRLTLTN
jgi:hypothetical protein